MAAPRYFIQSVLMAIPVPDSSSLRTFLDQEEGFRGIRVVSIIRS